MVFVVLLVDVVIGVGICVFCDGVGGLGVGIGGIGDGLSGIHYGVGGPSVATGWISVVRYQIGLQTDSPSVPTVGLSLKDELPKQS
ncbi:hypothetical protein P3L10_031224 [Capsicum annuum]